MNLRTIFMLLLALIAGLVIGLPQHAFSAPLSGLDETCLETELLNCEVLHSGYLSPEGGPRIAFQTQAGFTGEDGVKGGVVLFVEDLQGDWSLVARAFDAYRYEAPRLADHDSVLLHVPGLRGGTGTYNADLLFIWSAGEDDPEPAWRQVDIDTWRDTIGSYLPPGLEIWKGVDFSFEDWFWGEMDARTPLWLTDDGNCCPTGGEAIIRFLISGETLTVHRVEYLPPPKIK